MTISREEAAMYAIEKRKAGEKFNVIAAELTELGFRVGDHEPSLQDVERLSVAYWPGWGDKKIIERLRDLYSRRLNPKKIAKIMDDEGFRGPTNQKIGVATIRCWRPRIVPELAKTRFNAKARRPRRKIEPLNETNALTRLAPRTRKIVEKRTGELVSGLEASNNIPLGKKILADSNFTDAEKLKILASLLD